MPPKLKPIELPKPQKTKSPVKEPDITKRNRQYLLDEINNDVIGKVYEQYKPQHKTAVPTDIKHKVVPDQNSRIDTPPSKSDFAPRPLSGSIHKSTSTGQFQPPNKIIPSPGIIPPKRQTPQQPLSNVHSLSSLNHNPNGPNITSSLNGSTDLTPLKHKPTSLIYGVQHIDGVQPKPVKSNTLASNTLASNTLAPIARNANSQVIPPNLPSRQPFIGKLPANKNDSYPTGPHGFNRNLGPLPGAYNDPNLPDARDNFTGRPIQPLNTGLNLPDARGNFTGRPIQTLNTGLNFPPVSRQTLPPLHPLPHDAPNRREFTFLDPLNPAVKNHLDSKPLKNNPKSMVQPRNESPTEQTTKLNNNIQTPPVSTLNSRHHPSIPIKNLDRNTSNLLSPTGYTYTTQSLHELSLESSISQVMQIRTMLYRLNAQLRHQIEDDTSNTCQTNGAMTSFMQFKNSSRERPTTVPATESTAFTGPNKKTNVKGIERVPYLSHEYPFTQNATMKTQTPTSRQESTFDELANIRPAIPINSLTDSDSDSEETTPKVQLKQSITILKVDTNDAPVTLEDIGLEESEEESNEDKLTKLTKLRNRLIECFWTLASLVISEYADVCFFLQHITNNDDSKSMEECISTMKYCLDSYLATALDKNTYNQIFEPKSISHITSLRDSVINIIKVMKSDPINISLFINYICIEPDRFNTVFHYTWTVAYEHLLTDSDKRNLENLKSRGLSATQDKSLYTKHTILVNEYTKGSVIKRILYCKRYTELAVHICLANNKNLYKNKNMDLLEQLNLDKKVGNWFIDLIFMKNCKRLCILAHDIQNINEKIQAMTNTPLANPSGGRKTRKRMLSPQRRHKRSIRKHSQRRHKRSIRKHTRHSVLRSRST